MSGENQVQASRCPCPVESHKIRLIPPEMTCGEMCSVFTIRDTHPSLCAQDFCWWSVIQACSTIVTDLACLLKFQNLREKEMFIINHNVSINCSDWYLVPPKDSGMPGRSYQTELCKGSELSSRELAKGQSVNRLFWGNVQVLSIPGLLS